MPKCTDGAIELGRLGRRVIEANFEGGDIGSDGGVLLLRRADERIGLTRAAAAVLSDPRDPARITHSIRELLAQRIYGLCCGYEDLNDHDTLRGDLLMQTAVGRIDALASSPTLSRLETRATRAQAVALHGVLIEQFIASHQTPPEELVLDIDASDVPLHGSQEGSEFHAYYDHHCYLPLYVFCGQAMLACVLRRSRIDGAKNAAALIKLLVARLRQAWPETRIIVRGDSGFCRQRILRWCERSAVSYIIGLARNARLEAAVQYAEAMLADEYERSGVKQRLIDEFIYAADSWDIERRVITRLEHGAQGNNPRFVVTNLAGEASQLYERLYCARGEAENRIKEAQLDLFGTRASCHKFAANQLRVLLGALSGGERQALAIARALHFGARVLILDEPTAALGVKQASHVLRIVNEAKRRGLAVIFITHQVMHAMTVGDHFAVLIRGAIAADFRRGEKTREEVTDLMAGGESMAELENQIENYAATHDGHPPVVESR